jgi:hypothetical protein
MGFKAKDDGTRVFEIDVDDASYAKVLGWVQAKRGIAVWENHDLGSRTAGHLMYTPVRQTDGQEYGAPYADNDPVHAAEHGCNWRFVRVAAIETEDDAKRRLARKAG